jgi:thioredoxin 1
MEERDIAYKFKIRMIPTQIFFDKNNTIVYRHVGFLKKEKILKLLKGNK